MKLKLRKEKKSLFLQALLVKLDKIFNYQLRKDEEHDDKRENIHLTLQSIKRKLKRLNAENNGESNDE